MIGHPVLAVVNPNAHPDIVAVNALGANVSGLELRAWTIGQPVPVILDQADGPVWIKGHVYAGAPTAGIGSFSEFLAVRVIVHPHTSEIRIRPNSKGAPTRKEFPLLKDKGIIIVIEIAAETPVVVQPVSARLSQTAK